ncbi:MAG: hypothetical protein M1838_003073 [Thelocarpon superellum]|nr:MAG: hypothetical protein M1838_003073 [Thelocarpon superellum]
MSSVDPLPSSARKRQKLSSPPPSLEADSLPRANGSTPSIQAIQTMPSSSPASSSDLQSQREAEVGITEYVNVNLPRFSGILKKRHVYTDFLVNEILPSGEVVHLDNLKPPSKKPAVPKPSSQVPPASGVAGRATEDSIVAPLGAPEPGLVPTASTGEPHATPVAQEATDLVIKEQSSETIRGSDADELKSLFGEDTRDAIVALYERILASPQKKPAEFGSVKSGVIIDRQARTNIHQSVRRIFASRLDTTTDDDGAIVIACASGQWNTRARPGQSGQRGWGPPPATNKPSWKDLGGDHLHFSIYKENKDTMEVISFLARQLKVNVKNFQFAGTKDRRAVTVQRASVFRVNADRLAALNRSLRGSKLGGFEYRRSGLELGQLSGNEFVITLRDCHFPAAEITVANGPNMTEDQAAAVTLVEGALTSLKEQGYLNYFGLQRFGTFSARTDTIGLKMLQGEFKAACDEILSFNPDILAHEPDSASTNPKALISADDKARAQALHTFRTTGDLPSALQMLPYKFSAETALLRHLGHPDRSNDFQGALQSVPRNLRTMFVHAYQSLVWNVVAGERWKRHGSAVIAGDLVLVHEHPAAESNAAEAEEVDESGEVVIHAASEEKTRVFGDPYVRARALSQAEVDSQKYNVFDVVLPTPGFDVQYPANSVGDFYKTFMGSARGGGLDPSDMRRKWKDISLSGNYRKLLARPLGETGASFTIQGYEREDEQLVQTDLEKLQKTSRGDGPAPEPVGVEGTPAASKVAVILRLRLGTSQYATMALRELMGADGVKVHKPDYGGGR